MNPKSRTALCRAAFVFREKGKANKKDCSPVQTVLLYEI